MAWHTPVLARPINITGLVGPRRSSNITQVQATSLLRTTALPLRVLHQVWPKPSGYQPERA